jgi:hypothetical protein
MAKRNYLAPKSETQESVTLILLRCNIEITKLLYLRHCPLKRLLFDAEGLVGGDKWRFSGAWKIFSFNTIKTFLQIFFDSRYKKDYVSTSSKVLGRKSANAGSVEEPQLVNCWTLLGMHQKGDILYRGVNGWQLIRKGSAGQVLTTSSTDEPVWTDAAEGGGGGVNVDEIYALMMSLMD